MTSSDHISVKEYPGGISVIDSDFHREHMAGCYLVEAGSEVAFVEVGTNSSTPRLMSVLKKRGWKPQDVRYVIVTHVHLDHAGGSGSLMQLLPNATFLVHPYGARHMIDPTKLEAGSRVVYGDEMFDRIYGQLIPVAEQRVRIMEDGDEVSLGNRQLRFMDTPGHARHHFCVHDDLTNGWFTGDTFGLSYREFDTQKGAFLVPTTTPIQFDPVALKESVKKLVAVGPDCMYLTHYGRVDDVQRLAKSMIEGVDKMVGFAEQYKDDDLRRQKIETDMSAWLMDGLREHGVELSDDRCLELLHSDIRLNTAGIEYWLDHRDRRRSLCSGQG
ncbi:MAG: MBL fold metallo-hydrolase, partial [Gammaproteobacteria bacterium]|nr:MBL fold metallo-hydrolase [Gammaproteobacteria bacterium]